MGSICFVPIVQALAPCPSGRLLCGHRACLSRTLYGQLGSLMKLFLGTFFIPYYSYIISQLLILVVAFTATNTILNFAFSELPEYPGTFPRQTQDLSQTSQQTETLLPTTRP